MADSTEIPIRRPDGRDNRPKKTGRPVVLTAAERRREAVEKIVDRAELAERRRGAYVDHRRLPPVSERRRQLTAEDNQLIDQLLDPTDQQSEEITPQPDQRATDDQTTESPPTPLGLAREQAGKLARQAAATAAKRLTQLAGRSLLANPAVLGTIGVVLAGLVIFLVITFIAIGVAGSSATATGTSAVQPIEPANQNETAALEAVLAGGLTTPQSIAEAKAAVADLRERFGRQAAISVLLADIDAALDALSAATDQPSRDNQIAIIETKLSQLRSQLAESGGRTTIGANGTLLQVEGVGEGRGGQCGLASMVMVIRYIVGPRYSNPALYLPATNSTNPKAQPLQCVSPDTINQEAGRFNVDKTDWQRFRAGSTADKLALIEAMKRSIRGGDPLVLYLRPGGVITGIHIVAVIGYDPGDDSFYINNPFPPSNSADRSIGRGSVIEQTNRAAGSLANIKLTSDHLVRYMSPAYGTALIRGVYLR